MAYRIGDLLGNSYRHCERSEAISARSAKSTRLLRSARNDKVHARGQPKTGLKIRNDDFKFFSIPFQHRHPRWN